MKLPEFKVDIEKSENFNEEKFGIGNVGFILNILRNKLYSNVIESACREYASNGRDAHREIGTPDRPIEIHFPNAFESNFSVKDYGIGIGPQRMTKVFLQYGNSTKRNDNSQLGGFGLGAKLFMGYSDQFSIITTSKDGGGVNTKRTYILFIDSSQEGRLNLVNEEITNEPTGTEVICAVQDNDIQAFIDGTLKSTQYWEVKPLFFGLNQIPEYPQTVGDLIAESGTWKIYNKKNYNQYNSSKAESLAIIDGIQYKINESFVDCDDRWVLACNVHMYFGIGELTLSASRETLQYDGNTKTLINERIKLVQKELSEQIIELLDKKENYTEAVEFYNFMNLYFHKALNKQNLTWRGNKIIGSEISFSSYVLEDIKARILSYSKHKNYGKTSIRMVHGNRIIIDKNTEIYYNDIDPEHTYRQKNIKALESHSQIQIINYIKGKTYDDFVADLKQVSIAYFTNGAPRNVYSNEVDNSFILDIIKPKLLSSVIGDKFIPAPRIAKPKIPDKINGHRLTSSGSWKLRDHFVPLTLETDTEGCYMDVVFSKDQCTSKYTDTVWTFSANDMQNIKKLLDGIQIYSVKEKDLPKLTKIKPLSEVIESKFKKLITSEYYKSMAMNQILKTYGTSYYNNFSSLEELKELAPFKNKIKDKNSLIIKYFDYIKHFEQVIPISFLNKIEEALNQKNNIEFHVTNAKNLIDEMKSRYRLLNYLYNSAKKSDILDYINLCDEQYNQNQSTQTIMSA
jgi:hypothetical protein